MAYDAKLYFIGSSGTPNTATTTTTGSTVDLKTGTPRRGLALHARVYSLSGTSPTLAFKVQASNDATNFNDLALPEAGTITAAGMRTWTFETTYRYARVIATTGGTVATASYDVVLGTGRP